MFGRLTGKRSTPAGGSATAAADSAPRSVRGVLQRMMERVTQAMSGYVSTAHMLRRLLSQHAADEFGHLRSTIVGALVACGYVPHCSTGR
jgi:hypothetical protein